MMMWDGELGVINMYVIIVYVINAYAHATKYIYDTVIDSTITNTIIISYYPTTASTTLNTNPPYYLLNKINK